MNKGIIKKTKEVICLEVLIMMLGYYFTSYKIITGIMLAHIILGISLILGMIKEKINV